MAAAKRKLSFHASVSKSTDNSAAGESFHHSESEPSSLSLGRERAVSHPLQLNTVTASTIPSSQRNIDRNRIRAESVEKDSSSACTPARSLFKVTYCGSVPLERHHSRSSLPWLVAEYAQKGREAGEPALLKLSPPQVRVLPITSNSSAQLETDDAGNMLLHNLCDIQRYFRCKPDPSCFAYLVRVPNRNLSTPMICHVFLSADQTPVDDILRAMQHPSNKGSAASQLTTPTSTTNLCPTTSRLLRSDSSEESTGLYNMSIIGDSSTSRFEVLYVGRVDVLHRKPASTFIDDCLLRFNRTGVSYMRATAQGRDRSASLGNAMHSVSVSMIPENDEIPVSSFTTEESDFDANLSGDVFASPLYTPKLVAAGRNDSIFVDSDAENSPGLSPNARNRSMLLLIGLTEIRLISLDRKETLLVKKLTDLCRVTKAQNNPDHIGFLCPSAGYDYYVCYIIKCENGDIADTIMQSVRCSFAAATETESQTNSELNNNNKVEQHACAQCPMEQFARLCKELEGCNVDQIYETILLKIGFLDADQQEEVLLEYKRIEKTRVDEQVDGEESSVEDNERRVHARNVILMAALRSMCQALQQLHERQSINGNINQQTVDLIGRQQSHNRTHNRQRAYSGEKLAKKMNEFGGFAKRSFGQLGRKLSQENDPSEILSQLHAAGALKEEKESLSAGDVLGRERAQSSSCTSTTKPFESVDQFQEDQARFSPARKAFSRLHDMRPGSSRTSNNPLHSKWQAQSFDNGCGPVNRDNQDRKYSAFNIDANTPQSKSKTRKGSMSWRQAIFSFSRVADGLGSGHSSPRSFKSRASLASITSNIGLPSSSSPSTQSTNNSPRFNDSNVGHSTPKCDDSDNRSAYRQLWRKAIMQQIIENRMLVQHKMKEEERQKIERMKLKYDEITPGSDPEIRPIWTKLLERMKLAERIDHDELEDAVRAGIPRDLRAQVWSGLMRQHELHRHKANQLGKCDHYEFKQLIKELTPHQHSILLDLGRTFPSHPYFGQHLGPGQLSLYNILKAYSLYDSEVGYCQGLSFIAGALLLHTNESVAFDMFVDMMYRVGLRHQYMPDMTALQVRMYQLSRLVHDRHEDLHNHLEQHEIPMLYAAPWFLTLFASTFPLGFVARVFDCIFLNATMDVVFKIALVLLGEHKELIKQCSSFEDINEFLKTTLPEMGIIQMERIFNQVFILDISRELLAYEVEYHVLQDEYNNPHSHKQSINEQPLREPSLVGEDDRQRWEVMEMDYKRLQEQNQHLSDQLELAQTMTHLDDEHLKTAVRSALDSAASYKGRIRVLEQTLKKTVEERDGLRTKLNLYEARQTDKDQTNE